MPNAKAIIEDIARQAGTSTSTVYRALRNDPRVSTLVRQRVISEAERAGYSVAPAAGGGIKALLPASEHRKGRIPGLERLAVIYREPAIQTFFSEMFMELLQQGKARGFHIDASLVNQEQVSLSACLRQAVDSGADALILYTWEHLGPEEGRLLQQSSLPVILINRHVEGMTYAVTLDDYAAGVQAAQYLVSLGHRRIAQIAGPGGSSAMRERFAGFRIGLERLGYYDPALSCEPPRVQTHLWLQEKLQQFFSLAAPPTAIWAHHDFLAWTTVTILRAMGLRVPQDVSVVGFDNVSSLWSNDLTTFDHRQKELGKQAVHLLAGLFEGVIGGPVRVCVMPQLVERATTGPAPAPEDTTA